MHRALTIAEIVHQVVEEFSTAWICCHKGQTLRALAVTCRVFSEPALDIIWSDQNGLGHLVECLPSDLWTISDDTTPGTLTLRRPPRTITQQDWVRFDTYARRVRKLSFGPPKSSLRSRTMSADVFHWLSSSRPSHQLLPNLRRLYWSDDMPPGCYDYFHMFLGPRLCTLRISGPPPQSTTSHHAILSALDRLSQIAPDIEVLSVWGYQCEGLDPRPIPGHVCTLWRRLWSLRLGSSLTMTYDAFAGLSALPMLAEAALSLAGPFDTKCSTRNYTFPAMQTLDLTSETMADIRAVLSSCHFPRLRRMSLTSQSGPKADLLNRVLEAIHERIPHASLVYLKLHAGNTMDVGEIVNAASLRSLYDLHHLVYFDFVMGIRIALTDDDIKEMAMSWPHIKHLVLCSNASKDAIQHTWTHDPRAWTTKPTLEGLVHLARYCPSLELLALDADTSGAEAYLEVHPGEGYHSSPLRTIHVVSPPLSAIKDVAAFLYAVFPNVWFINGTDGTVVGDTWQLVLHKVDVLRGTVYEDEDEEDEEDEE
ncbi:uncharacterized protein C8Q71DRAFT_157144 [Rhodofomes roseus]|uniref:F-box domain-containing protein n=1 Tax=Rhodofomes roseus TaxID=34475 RepID=A0ABQ8KA26_9APHY|nr:uncharacterized protein C8Q71DRAFT_157144 [Rhodofomes roseus]KAH9834027.1 hypothetical protein C8Q71DRAFT_157144 [Rhodofomes roseus]